MHHFLFFFSEFGREDEGREGEERELAQKLVAVLFGILSKTELSFWERPRNRYL
jgi:hypothetical protein